jgi:hypothetical protein
MLQSVRNAKYRLHPKNITGRFYFARKCYALLKRSAQRIRPQRFMAIGDIYSGDVASVKIPWSSGKPVLFKESPTSIVKQVRSQAYSLGLGLSATTVQEVTNLSLTGICHLSNGLPAPGAAHVPDLREHSRTNGLPLPALAMIEKAWQNETIKSIALDENLLEVVQECLGYHPSIVRTFLFWSFCTSLDENARQAQQPAIKFHYDQHGYSFLFVNFYISKVNRETGAHVLVAQSHRRKSFGHVLGANRRSDRAILDYYGPENIHVIEGDCGTGFVEDATCFHKTLIPVVADRLMLQLRYR